MKHLFVFLLCAACATAQTTLSPAVKAFVTVDAPTIVLADVRVIDGTGTPAREHQVIVIRDGKIADVRPFTTEQAIGNVKVLNLSGHTVIPGLVGMHDHLVYPGALNPIHYSELDFSAPRLYLAGGVTTIRTTGSLEPYTDLSLKRDIDAGRAPGPRIFPTGPYLEGAGAYTAQMHELKDADDARRTVAYWAEEGADNFKAYMHITRAELSAAIEEAHKRGLKVTGHLCSIGLREAAALGIDDLEHGLVVDGEVAPGKQTDKCPEQTAIRDSLLKLDVNGPVIQDIIKDLVVAPHRRDLNASGLRNLRPQSPRDVAAAGVTGRAAETVAIHDTRARQHAAGIAQRLPHHARSHCRRQGFALARAVEERNAV